MFSHQKVYPEYFADSSNIPWNLPTIFRPSRHCNSTADVPSLTLRAALSAFACVSDLCGVDVQ